MLGCTGSYAQEIQNTLSYRDPGKAWYLRVNYENDLAFHTDCYYTQGVHFEAVSPRFNCKAVRLLFPAFRNSIRRYGIGLESAGYTPMTIFADSILYGDRPFAGMAYLKAFVLATNEARRTRVSAILSLGLMGPAAGGYEIQAFIHRYTANPDPVGWKYQVGNQVIINYEIDYERAIAPPAEYWLISIAGMARAGTLSTKAGAGFILMGGLYNNPFTNVHNNKKYVVYLYDHPEVNCIGYDAALQGGPFTKDNPYTIASADIARITFRNEFGLVLGRGRWMLSSYGRYLTKEFQTGKSHFTGGVYIVLAM